MIKRNNRKMKDKKINFKKVPKPLVSLYELACAAREKAYAPYSEFKVGAALVSRTGEIFTGCNVENGSYGATVCAERVALWKAVSEGHTNFQEILIVANFPEPCPPCGLCRQVLVEFMDAKTPIHMTNTKGAYERSLMSKLFALPFVLR